MKLKSMKLLAASVALGTFIPAMALANTASAKPYQSVISLDGKTISQPYRFVASDGSNPTTYMPMYYINQALEKAGYTVSWNGNTHTWTLTSSTGHVDLSGLPVGTGNTSIVVNGKVVKKINTIVEKDPAGGKKAAITTYVPIYYVMPILEAAGVQNTWNGKAWTATSPLQLDTASATYGPKTGTQTLSKDLVIGANGVTVQNVKVNGNIYINPGKDGTVNLDNVSATGAIVVLSGASHSIHLNNVTSPSLEVDSTSDVHIVTEGNTSIKRTVVPNDESNAVTFDQQSGTFGDVTVSSQGDVDVTGTGPLQNLTIAGNSNVVIGSGVTVANLTVSGGKANITISAGATVTNLTVQNAQSVQLTNNGTVTTLTNKDKSVSVSVGGTGTVTITVGSTTVSTPTGGGDTGGMGGGTGGGGGVTTGPTHADENTSLAHLAAQLQSLHDALAATGGLTAVQSAETAARSSSASQWNTIIYGTATPSVDSAKLSKVDTAIQTLMSLMTYSALSQDTNISQTNVQQILADLQSLDTPTASITGGDVYSLYTSFRDNLLVDTLNQLSDTSGTTSVSLTSLVGGALQSALQGTSPFSQVLSYYGIDTSRISAMYAQAHTDFDPSGDALNAIAVALGHMYLVQQQSTFSEGDTADYILLTNSAAPIANYPVPGTITWTSSNPSVASVSSGGTVTALATGTATIYAEVHGIKVFANPITVSAPTVAGLLSFTSPESSISSLTLQLTAPVSSSTSSDTNVSDFITSLVNVGVGTIPVTSISWDVSNPNYPKMILNFSPITFPANSLIRADFVDGKLQNGTMGTLSSSELQFGSNTSAIQSLLLKQIPSDAQETQSSDLMQDLMAPTLGVQSDVVNANVQGYQAVLKSASSLTLTDLSSTLTQVNGVLNITDSLTDNGQIIKSIDQNGVMTVSNGTTAAGLLGALSQNSAQQCSVLDSSGTAVTGSTPIPSGATLKVSSTANPSEIAIYYINLQ